MKQGEHVSFLLFLGWSHYFSSCSIGAKVFWILVTLIAQSIFGYYLVNLSIAVFKEKDTFTSITLVSKDKMPLPDITVCSSNPFQSYTENVRKEEESKSTKACFGPKKYL